MIFVSITAAFEADPIRQDRVKKLVQDSLFTLESETNCLTKARNSAESIERRRKYLEQNGSCNQPDSAPCLPMRLSPEELPADLRRYAEDILERLRFTKETRGLQGVFDKYNSLNWVLKTMALENGGYLIEYEDEEEVVDEDSKILTDIDFDYNTRINLEHFVDFLLRRTKQLRSWYWLEKTSQGHYRSVLLLSRLWKTLHNEVERTYSLIVSVGYQPSAPIASMEASSSDGSEDMLEKPLLTTARQGYGKTGNECLEIKEHIMMDSKKASMLYKALAADDVNWLMENMEEKAFVNRLTSCEGAKIKLHTLNQVHYIARKYVFPPEEGKTIRRITTEEWDLIRQVFDVEVGNMDRVNMVNKQPKDSPKVDNHMNSKG